MNVLLVSPYRGAIFEYSGVKIQLLGVSYIDKDTGSIVNNPGRPFIQNLDDIPFPIREANWRYGKASKSVSTGVIEYPLITTRGCPYSCNFCDVHLKTVELLKQNGIETCGAFLLGEPSETKEDVKRMIDFAKYINPGITRFSILTPCPGTELWQNVGSKIITKDWEKYDAMYPVFKTDNFKPGELEKILMKAYINFYKQPKRILKEMFKGEHYGRPNLKRILEILKALKIVFEQA